MISQYTYNKEGLLVQEKIKEPDDTSIMFYIYNKDQIIIGLHHYTIDLVWKYGFITEFDKNGREVDYRVRTNPDYKESEPEVVSPYTAWFSYKTSWTNFDSVERHIRYYDNIIFETAFEYDSLQRLTQKQYVKNDTIKNSVTYVYNDVNQIIEKHFYWFNIYQMVFECNRVKYYSYDAIGNRTDEFIYGLSYTDGRLILKKHIKYNIEYYE
ncbi:MAG: hypothetical protein ACI8SE_000629 [Bacteroidia bacterium]|jgi:hypothetical protein